jgi:hypothetical protein
VIVESVIAESQPAPAPVVAAPASVAAAPAPDRAPAAPVKLEWPSDLQQVETSKERVQAAEQASNDGAPKRVKRARPQVAQVVDEPLQQVETRG